MPQRVPVGAPIPVEARTLAVRIRLYLDEDSSDTDLVKALCLRGVDVLSASEAGMRNECPGTRTAHSAALPVQAIGFQHGSSLSAVRSPVVL